MTTDYFCDQAWLGGAEVSAGVSISVVNGNITNVTPGVNQPPTGAIRLRGLTVPGFANAHSHAFHRALRGRTHRGSDSFWTWRNQMYQAATRLTPESYNKLAKAVFAEMLTAGYTAVGEFHYVHHNPDGTPYTNPNAMGEALVDAAVSAGIRLTLLNTMYLHGGLGPDGYQAMAPQQQRFSDRTAEAFLERIELLRPAPGVIHGLAVHSVRAVDPESIAVVSGSARPMHVHLSEQPGENEQCFAAHGMSPTQVLADAGALSRCFTAVHATHLTRNDIRLLGQARTTACFCPTTERDLADGIGPASDLAGAGVSLAIGSDSHAVIDPIEETRAIELDERLASGARATHSPEDLMTAATTNGYQSLGWEGGGVIAVGAPADFVSVSLDSVRLAGHDPADPLAAVLFSATSADITDVVVGGDRVVSAGKHHSIDVASDLSDAIEALR